MHEYATVQKLLCDETLRTYLEPGANIVLSVVAARPTAVSTKPIAGCSSLKKSLQIHASS